ncbi:MAG: NAD(P)H-dependent oxidoreductase [Eggerthellaceae bacterium]|nr:NAD(P)H-dependent oxidoreductase [Eggerthellaceae bacterium]
MHRVIVVGSPRANGRSAALADELFNACIEECPEDGVSIVSVASIKVEPCCGCDACRTATQAPESLPEDDDNLAIMPLVAQSDAVLHRCVIHDDMTEVRKHLDAADELIVVCPVYFAGAPAQMKALLDRLQPYYWSDVRRQGKRPMVLHVVGEGGDPHGFEPLISTVRSAFMCVGFELELVLDWVGKIDAEGEIVAEADEYPIPPMGGFGALDYGSEFEFVEVEDASADDGFDDGSEDDFEARERGAADGRRPKLSLADSERGREGKDDRAQGGQKRSGKKQGGGKAASGKASGGKASAGKAGKASYGKNTPKKGGKRRG